MSYWNPDAYNCDCYACKTIRYGFNDIDREVKQWVLEGKKFSKELKKAHKAIKLMRKLEFDNPETQYLSGIFITRILWWKKEDLNVWKKRWGIQDNCIRCHKKRKGE